MGMIFLTVSILLFAFFVPASTWAACAWILWEESEHMFLEERPSRSWSLHIARPTQVECEEVLTRVWQVQVRNSQPGPETPGIKETKSAPGYVAVTFQKKDGEYAGSASHRFVCLPDTIDPRAPKP